MNSASPNDGADGPICEARSRAYALAKPWRFSGLERSAGIVSVLASDND